MAIILYMPFCRLDIQSEWNYKYYYDYPIYDLCRSVCEPMTAEVINTTISKSGHLFKSIVVPLAAGAVGYFTAPLAFGWLAATLSSVNFGSASTGDMFGAFGANRNGTLMVTGFLLLAIGFGLFTMDGWPVKAAGIFVLGCGIRSVADGFNNKTWG